MKYKENDEIWIKARIESYNAHRTDSFLPYHVSIEANGKNSDGFLTYINISDQCETKPVEDKCSCYQELHNKPVCYGTKELDECDCDGIPSKCSFYEDVRTKSKERIYTIAESTDEGTIVTAEMYQAALQDISNMAYIDILNMMDWETFVAPDTIDECIIKLINQYTPKKVVDRYEKYQEKMIVHQNDVIQGVISDPRKFLVTKIDGCLFHLISKDGYTKTVNNKCVINNEYKKVGKNMTIQEFFSKEV